MDNMDAFGLLVPLTFDGAKITPWGMYSMIGPNTFRDSFTSRNGNWSGNLKTHGRWQRIREFRSLPGWAARATRISAMPIMPAACPLMVMHGGAASPVISPPGILSALLLTFEYGSVTWDDDGRLNRQGWFATLLAEYKLDWATPGIYGWYASGDDDNPANGSERLCLPLDGNNTNKYSNFAFDW